MCYGMSCKYERHPSGECRGPVDWSKPDAACREVEEEDQMDVRNQLIGLLNDYWWGQWVEKKETSDGGPTALDRLVADEIIKLVNGKGK